MPVPGEGAHLCKGKKSRKAGVQGSECLSPEDAPSSLWVTAAFLGLGLQLALGRWDFRD